MLAGLPEKNEAFCFGARPTNFHENVSACFAEPIRIEAGFCALPGARKTFDTWEP
jgi:hypothetical protein